LIDLLRAERGARSAYFIGCNRTNESNSNVIDLGQPVGNNSTTAHRIPSYQAGFETINYNASGMANALGMYWLDAPNRTIGVQGTPFTSEAVPGDGQAVIKLGEITTPPASVGADPLANTQARRRNVHLREVLTTDVTGKIFYQTMLASETYSKTSNDGTIGGTLPVWL
jgi:hypothetical protein